MKKNQKTIKTDEFGRPLDFEWPEYNTDSKRIKAYSNIYRKLSISEAFEKHYNLELKVEEAVNIIPQELHVGDVFKTRILSIGKDKVTFDTQNYKTNLISGVNLYKYEKFKHFLPMDEIKVSVSRVDKDRVTIDPISPMINDWLQPILKDPTIQKVIPNAETGAGPKPIIVKDLQLIKGSFGGGFIGKAVIPSVSEFVGEDYTMDAFIPGSQIVLNITEDFEQFNGKSVLAFVMNYIPKPGISKSGMSLICSAKEYIKFGGELKIIDIFKEWCESSEAWNKIVDKTFEGKVTGVINTSKKCGVFVEIPELSITGMVATKPDVLVEYPRHKKVEVKLTGFDEETYFDPFIQQIQHVEPYEIENGILKKCNIKPILKFA